MTELVTLTRCQSVSLDTCLHVCLLADEPDIKHHSALALVASVLVMDLSVSLIFVGRSVTRLSSVCHLLVLG